MAELRKVEFGRGHMQLNRHDVCSTCRNSFAVVDTHIIPLVLPSYSSLPPGAGEGWRAGGRGEDAGRGSAGMRKQGGRGRNRRVGGGEEKDDRGRQREFMDLRQSDRPLRQIVYYIHYRKIYYKYKVYIMYGPARV